jgi:hypothetical protein
VVIVADHRTGALDSYGPLEASAAARVLVDLRELFLETGVEDVSAIVGRLHHPDAPAHPEDP